jgi:amino-acid N-acetyltransferase
VHADFQGAGRGEALVEAIEDAAREQGLKRLFVLTTRTAHWFVERGFVPASPDELPATRKEMYNWQRRSKVLIKSLGNA